MSEPEEKSETVAAIVSPKSRSATVTLDWPVEFDGKVYEELTIRRVTGLEVQKFLIAAQDANLAESSIVPPMVDCPSEVWANMDDDDRMKVEDAMLPFMPRRLMMALGLTPATSDSSSAE